MNRKIIMVILVLLSFSSLNISFSEGIKQENIKDTNVSFYLDDELVNSTNTDYPIISYKDIIYIPMSYSTSKSFGLSTTWNNENQELDINSSSEINLKKYSCSKIKNVSISYFSVFIDTEKINSIEYPNLLIDGVIYIPLVYENIKKLQWSSEWDSIYGLKIYTKNYVKDDKIDLLETNKLKEIEFMMSINKKLEYNEAKYYLELMYKANVDYGIDVHWIMAMMWLESNYDKDCEYKNAIGLMQMLESTGKTMGITRSDLHIPAISIDSGVKYLKLDLDHYNGNLDLATLAYNQGSVRVDKGTYSTWYLENIKSKYEKINEYVK